jgi:hypothetical protein
MRKIPIFAGVAVVCAALAGAAADADADAKRPVTLAECSSSVSSRSLPDVAKLLRQDVETELDAVDWTRARAKGKRLTMSAALVTLESVKSGQHGVRTSCTVSATLRDDHGGLVATLQGHADGEDDARATARVERDAMKLAAKGAVAHVPEAVERVP